ncbi:MAG: ferrochelatase [Chloroflexi bacterium]|nr:ferrochelatase [Chloroflexota bacterium]
MQNRTASVSAPIGVLLANVGTPDAPTPAALRRYLAEFLSDPRIVDYPAWLWKPFLHGILLRFRPRRSARLYARVWTEAGSPLLTGMTAIRERLQERLDATAGRAFRVEIGMRYGSPGIWKALKSFADAGVYRLLVLPLFPQYSGTTTGSVYDAVFAALHSLQPLTEVRMLRSYHAHSAYLGALTNAIRCHWQHARPDRLVISFHGIPQRYARAGDPYPAQCRETAERLAIALGLEPSQWVMGFQSRFGPEKWLEPATDNTLTDLGRSGVGAVDVVCPGFAVDCLETLDEIGHEGRLRFTENGGKILRYLPALNANDDHIALLQTLVEEQAKEWH